MTSCLTPAQNVVLGQLLRLADKMTSNVEQQPPVPRPRRRNLAGPGLYSGGRGRGRPAVGGRDWGAWRAEDVLHLSAATEEGLV